ncbi:MAG: type II secretion system protein [bacterium]|nr:type II secretion system protein [bacterium]
MNKVNTKKGFTLIELLIVIGILAILATVTLLVLNPAQMFAQARDSQRISDLNTIKSAIALYTSTVTTPYLSDTAGTNCATKIWGTIGTSSPSSGTIIATRVFADTNKTAFIGSPATTTVGINGWVPVALADTAGGSPISSLPLDPTSPSATTFSNTNATYAYFYTCSTTGLVFELNATLESTRYSNGGTDDKESSDGGDRTWLYETGSALNL